MNIYIWREVDKATGHYHPGGGVAVIAPDEDRARTIAREYSETVGGTRLDGTAYSFVTHSAGECVIPDNEAPDFVAPVECAEERVFIFPNAGCC